MGRKIINFFRTGRSAGLRVLSPFDYLFRVINCKPDLPPLHLRRYVGPLRSFESSGAEFMSHLRTIARLKPDERILDIGCGCGQMALHLKNYLDEKGSYTGVDIHRPSIKWCQKNIGRRHSNFQFAHIDVRNQTFNPQGLHRAEEYRFPYDDGAFDVILLKSVFTHMRPAEVDNYLAEVARLLNANGRCLATFFLLNKEQAGLASEGRSSLPFEFGEGVWRYRYEHSPESAVAYDESFVMESLEKHGLVVKQLAYGTWSGRKDALSYQDILLVEKR